MLAQNANASPADLCKEVFSNLLEIQGESEQYDDMAMLVIGVES
jgi:serine phosphatase RsbU (regulator of sigma subunit)